MGLRNFKAIKKRRKIEEKKGKGKFRIEKYLSSIVRRYK